MEKIFDIMNEVQRTSSNNKSSLRKLQTVVQEIIEESNVKHVTSVLQSRCIDSIIVIAKKDSAVEKAMDFLCSYLANESTPDYIFSRCISHLLQRSGVADKTVRFRSCQMIAGILSNMTAEAEISDELWDDIVRQLTPRLRDKNLNVRIWAVKAIERIQNPEDENDYIIGELLRLMKSDSSALARISALENVRITKRTLPHIVERVRDVKAEVRVAVLKRLGKEVNFKYLNAAFRNAIIRSGLHDRDSNVRKAAIDVISKWIGACDNRIPSLLHLLQLQVYEEDAVVLAWTILDCIDKGEIQNPTLKQLVREQQTNWYGSFAAMNPSEILWTKVRCDYARAKYSPASAAETLDNLLPDIVVLCELLADGYSTSFEHSPQQKLAMKYLLDLTTFLESSDVSGRNRLVEICLKMIKNMSFPDDLLEPVLEAWARCEPDETLNSLAFDLALSVKASGEMYPEDSEDSELAAFRCLDIFLWTLTRLVCKNAGHVEDLNATEQFNSLVTMVWESLQQPNSDFRCLAVKGLGLLGLCSERLCSDNYEIILQVACNDVEENEIRCQAVQILSDFAMIYPAKFSNDSKFAHALIRLQENSDAVTARVAIESAAKLIFSKLMSDSKLFANVIKFFFLPEVFDVYFGDENEENFNDTSLGSNTRLQQMLSVFFQVVFKFGSNRVDVALESISSLVPDIAMLIRSGDLPTTSFEKIVGHLLDLHRQAVSVQQGSDAEELLKRGQATISASISREILKLGVSKIDRAAAKDYIKALCSIAPESWLTPSMAVEATQVAGQIFQTLCTDRSSLKLMEKYHKSCQQIQEATSQQEEMLEYHTYFTLAPGLADLIETTHKPRHSSDRRRPTTKKVDLASDDEEETVSPNVSRPGSLSGQFSNRGQLSRSSKIAASAKIASQSSVDDENEANRSSEGSRYFTAARDSL